MKVFDYQIKNILLRPSDDRVMKIYSLLGKKFHLHTIEYSFTPEQIYISDEGVPGKVVEIINYKENGVFAKILVDEDVIFANINDREISVDDEVFISFNADDLGIKDVNFKVIIF